LLRLLHPLLPFVTEALWRALTGEETLVTTRWPTAAGAPDTPAEEQMRRLRGLVAEIRRFRAQQGIQPGRLVPATLAGDLATWAPYIGALAQLSITCVDEMPAGSAVLTSSGMRIGLDLSGAVDEQAEKARLGKRLAAAEKERDQTTRRLADEGFLQKAPDQVIASMRKRAAAAEAQITRLQEQLRSPLSRIRSHHPGT
jgi:valyl-tRNA synthetase